MTLWDALTDEPLAGQDLVSVLRLGGLSGKLKTCAEAPVAAAARPRAVRGNVWPIQTFSSSCCSSLRQHAPPLRKRCGGSTLRRVAGL